MNIMRIAGTAIAVGAAAAAVASIAAYQKLKANDRESKQDAPEDIKVANLTIAMLNAWFRENAARGGLNGNIFTRDALIRNGMPTVLYDLEGESYVLQSVMDIQTNDVVAVRCVHFDFMEDKFQEILKQSSGVLVITDLEKLQEEQ